MLDKKISKEISNLLVSSDRAKKALSNEIDKIDAKYKALAEKEKSKLSKMLKSIEEQMESYKTLLGLEDETETMEPEEVVNDDDEKVVDDLFPENNADKTPDEFVTGSEPEAAVEEEVPVTDNSVKTVDEWPAESEESGKKDNNEDEWPDFPTGWGQ